MSVLRILTFNWHETYLCLLARTGHRFTVVDKDKGGHRGWLAGTRPVPPNIELLAVGSEEAALRRAASGEFDLAIAHNLRDLHDLWRVSIPKVAVFHNRLSTEIELFRAGGRPAPNREQYVAQFLSLFDQKTHAVFISEAKLQDARGIDGTVILPGIDLNDYGGYRGEVARVLRVGNFFTGRDLMLGQTAATDILGPLPVTVLGINPEIPGSRLSTSWEDLKHHFRSYRVYLNTTVEGREDGYNLSMLEAMATGMPVVSSANSTSPIEDAVNGFVSDDHATLRRRLQELLDDRELARQLGRCARKTVARRFPIDRFVGDWNRLFRRVLAGDSTAGPHRDPRDAVSAEIRQWMDRQARSLAGALIRPSHRDSGDGGGKDVGTRLGKARILMSAGKIDEATRYFQAWRAEEQGSAYPLIGLGAVALASGRWEDAERSFRSATALAPTSHAAVCGLGATLCCRGREPEGVDFLIESLSLGPLPTELAPLLACAAAAAGRTQNVLEAIRDARNRSR